MLVVYGNEDNVEGAIEREEFIPKSKPKNKSYLYKYKNFVCSPRTKFITETVN